MGQRIFFWVILCCWIIGLNAQTINNNSNKNSETPTTITLPTTTETLAQNICNLLNEQEERGKKIKDIYTIISSTTTLALILIIFYLVLRQFKPGIPSAVGSTIDDVYDLETDKESNDGTREHVTNPIAGNITNSLPQQQTPQNPTPRTNQKTQESTQSPPPPAPKTTSEVNMLKLQAECKINVPLQEEVFKQIQYAKSIGLTEAQLPPDTSRHNKTHIDTRAFNEAIEEQIAYANSISLTPTQNEIEEIPCLP